ncbi:DUF1569 domain-containing protein [Ferruginibacter sp. HRS2-29]|uniref:DUF1569 domain-containing protein n=1 Tax=Ferruginibacter sp. HRS2-29 TaxID=2487334 RepID=UPI0020CDEEDF|nr:DUF1569 domain-containing protein [Ferruginibacter sp. HRS2-29]MCP9749556.1 DUF1569 domain-containing protein [Ferruginibacter sp. HRS2-29]
MPSDQLDFITNKYFVLLNDLSAQTPAKWGVMNPQQMLEHVTDFFNVSADKLQLKLVTPEEHLPKYLEFLYSEKQFRENTKAPVEIIGEAALPERCASIDIAKEELRQSVDNFVNHFKGNHPNKTLHPVFGWLDFEQWVRLHYKHVTHHSRQFGLL